VAQHKESFTRWQSITIEQLTYAVGLILGFATASLGFALSIIKDSGYSPGRWSKAFMLASGVLLISSICTGSWCVLNRLKDFRKTSCIARDREDWCRQGMSLDDINRKLETRRSETKRIGEISWILFYSQIVTFVTGVAALIASFVAAYHTKIL
jgi:hypothetical protein